MMTPNSAESIFVTALEKTGSAARASYLDEACIGNDDLRREVERLLEAHPRVGGFLEQPIVSNLADEPSPDLTNADSDGQVRKQLDETQAEASISEAVDDQLTFLTPSQKPGSLGRLDHYEILEVVGKGGFGTVLKAFDEKLHRVVAIKTLSPELAASGTARQRFIREARTAAAVTHEHVVTIHAVVEEHRPPYLVMQMIDGVTLQQKLDKSGTLSLREILRIGMQMAEGLAAAHKQGLVHRDIKPANILLENGIERVKITDFGLAQAVDDASVTQSGVVAGTPMYMSPEQAEGLQIDHRSDLFGLGTVLYAMCTGHPPFRASSTMAVLKRVTDALTRPIREINTDIPDWLCEIIAKLHAKKPEDRFQTAKEVAEVLGQHLSDVQTGRAIAPPAQAAVAAPKPGERSRVGKWAVLNAVLVLLVLAGAAWWYAPTLSRFYRDTGKVVLEADSDEVQHLLLRKDGEIVTLTVTEEGIELPPGDHELEAVAGPGRVIAKMDLQRHPISI